MARRPSTSLYRSRRDFRRTPEPSGARQGTRWKKDRNPIFVIQHHRATSDHYDVRVESGGVLVSWAVPKGPSTDPRQKRLAVRTEDHPLSYADFEGVIPQGEYGGGTVLVWDAGPYRNLTKDENGKTVPVPTAIRRGQLEIWVEGKKIRGGYAFVHARLGGKDANWLLVKMDDEAADARRNPVRSRSRSVISGRTLAEIRKEEGEGDG